MCKWAVVDLEMCEVPLEVRKGVHEMGKVTYRWAHETIQIAAVLLNEDLEIEDTFMTYVSPEYGFINTFINKLTGISMRDVASAPTMRVALQAFIDWLPPDVKVVSWSNSDKVQIKHEISAKSITITGIEEIFDNWIDCQQTFAEKMHTKKCYKLSEALVAADIIYKDGAHDGLVDAYNTALLFAKMERERDLVLNPYYQEVLMSEEKGDKVTLGDLFAGSAFNGLVFA